MTQPSPQEELILNREELTPEPIAQFNRWFADAKQAKLPQPEAMTLALASPEGRPSARIVLLKEVNVQGFVFFTNYESFKGKTLLANPQAELVFFWSALERQVRVFGDVQKVTAEESDTYHQKRPRGSRISAWSSPQSQTIENREELLARREEIEAQFANQDTIPRPSFWGGFRICPQRVEFWQGRPHRLHDRFVYQRQPNGEWNIQRLAP